MGIALVNLKQGNQQSNWFRFTKPKCYNNLHNQFNIKFETKKLLVYNKTK